MTLFGNQGPLTASAQEGAAPRVEQVRVGFGGKYKVGFWTTVRLDLVGGEKPFAGKLILEIPDAEGGPCRWASPEGERLTLGPGEKKSVIRYVKFGRLENRLTAIFEPEEGAPARIRLDSQLSAPEPTTTRYAIGLGDPLDWTAVAQQRRLASRETVEVLPVTSATELPDSPLGYDGLDFVCVTTSDLQLLEQCTPAQRQGLVAWIRGGGRLLLSAGANGEAVLGPGGLLAELAPGKWGGVVQQSSMKNLEGTVHAEVRLDSVGGSRDRDFSLPLAILSDYSGRLMLDEAGDDGSLRPVAISSPSGFGQIVFVGLDLGKFPFAKKGDQAAWASTPALLERLLDELMGQSAKLSNEQGTSGNLGYGDLAGQFQTALDRFPGVSLVPFSALVALILGYGLIVTVADYFFLRRLVRRMEWTWLTFPIVAILFCGVAIGFVRSLRSSAPKARQVDLVDIDAVGGEVRGRTWLHLYSPATEAYDVSFARDGWKPLSEVKSAICWHAMPGKGVGGMDRRALTSVFDEPYVQSQPGAEAAMSGLPIQFASSRRLLDEWSGKVQLAGVSELKVDENSYLRGSFVNPLAQTLDNVLLIYRNSAYRFSGSIAAGQRQFIDPSDAPMNLNWLVTQRRTVETKDVSTPWDPTSEDISRLIEIFTLHQAAGAESYTGLANRYYRSLDLTEHAVKGEAILFGRIKQPISQAKIVDGAKRPIGEELETWTYVRILLPVADERGKR